MPTIFELVNDALGTLSPAVPFGMDVYIGDLPNQFIVYSLISGVPEQHAEKVAKVRLYGVQVNIMDINGLTSLPNVDAAMTAAGFVKGPERSLPKDRDTSHYGLAKDYFYVSG